MADVWIPMRTDLAEDPAVIAIASRLGIDEDTVVGKLHRFWSWANKQSRDGNAHGVTQTWLDRYLRCDGFARAMEMAGWLEVTKTGIRVPRFDSWNSKSAKERALTARRAATLRERKSNADTVTKGAPREEKRIKAGRRATFRHDLKDLTAVISFGARLGLPDDRKTRLRLTAYASRAGTAGRYPRALFSKMVEDLAAGEPSELTDDERAAATERLDAWEASQNGQVHHG